MTQVKKNLLANYVSSGWILLLAIASVPFYLKFLGDEAYGVVGLSLLLQGLIAPLDFGLSTVINRELARLSVQPQAGAEMRNLVRSLEIPYWLLSLGIAIVLAAISLPMAMGWVQRETLGLGETTIALVLMGLSLGLFWPSNLYSGGLMGLQKQVLLSWANMVMFTLRYAGGVVVLWLVSPSLWCFFTWLCVLSLVQSAWSGILLWRSLPPAVNRPRFKMNVLRPLVDFAGGNTGIAICTLVLMNMDKLVLSKILPLAYFGYYTVAWTAASGLLRVFQPFYQALFPRFTQLLHMEDWKELSLLYHRGCQCLGVLAMPITVVMAFFSRDILLIWTGKPILAEWAWPVLILLVTGMMLNGLLIVPFGLQLAHAWTRLSLITDIAAVVVSVPVLIVLAMKYQAVGAGVTWVLLTAGLLVLTIPLMHRRLLKGEGLSWLVRDVLLPLAGPLAVAAIAWALLPSDTVRLEWISRSNMHRFGAVLALCVLTGIATTASAAGANLVRAIAMEKFPRRKELISR